jgi:hypothetical protein
VVCNCALARHPNVSPAGENSLNPIGDLAALSTKAAAELSALREAYRAIACIHNLLLCVQESPKGERYVSRSEVKALVELVNSEFERRASRRCAAHPTTPARTRSNRTSD